MHTPPERNWDETIVRYPDPAIEVLDPRFGKYKIGNSVVERLWTGRVGPKDPSGSAMADIYSGVIYRTIGS